jgi:hypothetical protein
LENWPLLIFKTYDFCLRADEDPEGFRAGKYDDEIEAMWTQWMHMRRMISSPTLPPSQMLFKWGGGEHVHRFSPSGAWQTLRAEFSPIGSVVVEPYHAPCRVWFRRATWKTASGDVAAQLVAGPGGVMEEMGGVKRLSVLGPQSLQMDVPPGANTLELEVFLQSNEVVLAAMIAMRAR